jgi:molecular chaperone DnaK
VTEAVISVPVSFNERQRQVIREAGAIAGLEIKRIINEPIAVALAYGIRKTKKEQLIAVCSMGGGAFEVSIHEVGGKVVETVAVCGDNHLGGDDLDHRLIDWLVGEFRKDTSIDVAADKKVIQRLREAAERAKLELSERQETEFHLPALTVDASGPKHLQKTLSRVMFENLIEDLVERTIISCRKALADAGKQVTDLHAVVLAGGSTRIPRVAARLEEFFGRKADRSMNADEAVALGAAIQAGILSGDLKGILLLDTTSLSLAIEVAGGVANVLIPRNTTIPTRKTELVSLPTADHTAVSLHVIQGEHPAAKDNTTIGRFQLTGLPSMPPGVRPIEVTFDIDANAVVHVAAKDKATGLGETFRIGMPSALGGDPSPRLMGRLEDIADRNKKARGMYGETPGGWWSVSSKIERFQCKKCGFASNVQIVGEGEGTHDKAQRSAQEDLARIQRLITCYQCGYRDPSAFRLERAKSAAILLGGAAMFGVAALVNKSWYFFLIGAAVTWLCWAWWRRQQSRPDDHVIFLDDKNCALPRRSLR